MLRFSKIAPLYILLIAQLIFKGNAQSSYKISLPSHVLKNTDSLAILLDKYNKQSMEYLKTIMALEENYASFNKSKHGKYLEDINQLSKKLHNQYSSAFYTFHNGINHDLKGEKEKAYKNYLDAIERFIINKDTVGLVSVYNRISNLNLSHFGKVTGSLKVSYEYCQKSLQLAQKSKNPELILASLGASSGYYYALSPPDLARIETIEKQKLKILDKNPHLSFYRIGIVTNLATVYYNQGKFEQGYLLLRPHLIEFEKKNTTEHFKIYLNNLAIGATHTNRTDESEYILKKLLSLTNINSKSDMALRQSIYLNLKELYEYKDDYKTAYAYYDTAYYYRDSLLMDEMNKQLGDIETKYKTKEIQLENEAKSKELLGHKVMLLQSEAKSRNLQLLIAVIIIILMALTTALFYYRYANRQRVSILLGQMKEHLLGFEQTIKTQMAKSATEVALLGGNMQLDSAEATQQQIETFNSFLNANERKALSEVKDNINSLSKSLKTKIDNVKTFSYSISHDLKYPVQTSRQIIENYGTEDFDVEELRQNLLHADILIKTYSQLAEIESYQLHVKEIELKALVLSEINKIKKLDYFKPNCTIEVDISGKVKADALLLRQVLWNLLSNAVKYSTKTEHPIIQIKTIEDTPNCLKITISDNGIGFLSELKDQLFMPFSRVTNANNYEGTGIGLTLCREIISKLGGSIDAYSEGIDTGAQFYITLPKI